MHKESLFNHILRVCLIPLILTVIALGVVFSLLVIQSSRGGLRSSGEVSLEKIESKIQNSLKDSTNFISGIAYGLEDDFETHRAKGMINGFSKFNPKIFYFYFVSEKNIHEPGGIFIDSSDWHPDKSWSPYTREWYKLASENRNIINYTEPYIDDKTGTLIITASKWTNGNHGTMTGVLGIDININDFRDIAGDIQVSKNSTGYLVTNDGTYITNDDTNAIMNKNFYDDHSFIGKENFRSLIESVDGKIHFIDGKYYIGIRHIEGTPYNIIIEGPLSDATDDFYKTLFNLSLIILGVIVALSTIIFILSRFLGKIFKELASDCHTLAEGDFTVKIKNYSVNEAQVLGDGFRNFISNVSGLLKNISTTSDDMEHSSVSLGEVSGKINEAADSTSSSIDGMSQIIVEDMEAVNSVNNAVSNIVNKTKNLSSEIETQNTVIEESSMNIEKIISQVATVSETTETAMNSTKTLVKSASENKELINRYTQEILAVKEESGMLMEMNRVISAVAEQTNLLAMNAAIEAAHAGEAGKGFAVVADEIRKLAETTSKQAKDSEQSLNSIQSKIASIADSSVEVENSFGTTIDHINSIDRIVKNLKEISEEQNSQAKEVSYSLDKIKASTANVRTNAESISDTTKETFSICEKLEEMSNRVDIELKRCRDQSSQMTSAAEDINSVSLQVKEYTNALNEFINTFKI